MKSLKIVAIGIGSQFGRGLLADIFKSPGFNEFDCTLALVDTDKDALDRMYKFGLLLKKHFSSNVNLTASTDRETALPGADYVITSVAIKRYPLWEQDFRIPLAYGFKHILGENGGPGAAFHALRNYQLIIPIVRDMERLCPNATFLNFTNPEARIMMALSKLSNIKSVGLCHGVMGARDAIRLILDKPLEELDIITGGMNHFFWVLKIADKKSGQDLYPKLLDRVLNDPDCPMAPPLVRKMVEVFGHFTYPSDDHIGEYLSFAYEFTGLKWHYGRECLEASIPFEAPWHTPVDEYIAGTRPLDEDATKDSGELAIPVILGIEQNLGNWECAVNMPNTGLYIENLESDAIVEVPAVMDSGGVHPQKVGRIPDALAALTTRQVTIQKLVVEAYRTGSRNLLLQALILDPVVDSVERAEKMLTDMLEIQKAYLPEFH